MGSMEPACHARYEFAWGQDYDRLGKVQPVLNRGELPPATPDPSQMFKESYYQGRPIRNHLQPQYDNFKLSLNSPMFIPVLDAASPRPTNSQVPTR